MTQTRPAQLCGDLCLPPQLGAGGSTSSDCFPPMGKILCATAAGCADDRVDYDWPLQNVVIVDDRHRVARGFFCPETHRPVGH